MNLRKRPGKRNPVTCPKCGATGFAWYEDLDAIDAKRRRWHLVDEKGEVHHHLDESAERFIDRMVAQWKVSAAVSGKDIGRQGRMHWVRVDWEFVRQGNQPEKVFAIERLRFERMEGVSAYGDAQIAGVEEYRIGYWIVGKIGRAAGEWTWGQFSPLIPVEDLTAVIAALERLEERRVAGSPVVQAERVSSGRAG